MLYVATVHFRSTKWIDIQLDYLRRNVHVPYRTVAALEDVPAAAAEKFDRTIQAMGPHSGKLNLLAAEICAQAEDDDVIAFLDGDAFFVTDPMVVVAPALEHTSLVAVRRDENLGDRQPHPCFCAITVAEWQRLQGDWSEGHTWVRTMGKAVTDVGGNLLGALERTGSSWTPLTRSNVVDPHPVSFAVYGGIVYHHGAGFRRPFVKADGFYGSGDNIPRTLRRPGEGLGERWPLVGGAARWVQDRRRGAWLESVFQKNEAMGEEWYRRLQADPEFYRALTDPPVGAAAAAGSAAPGSAVPGSAVAGSSAAGSAVAGS